ncbi:MAG: glycosyltransferase family 4 protein [Thermodesulfobacteriota bacterium]
MKIAYLGIKGLPSKAGADRVVESLVERLKEHHEITVYCSRRHTSEAAEIEGMRLVRLPCLSGKHTAALSLFFLSAIHALVKGDYDLIHVHNAEACFVSPLLRIKYPVVSTSHGPAYAREKWGRIAKFLIRLIDYFFIRFSNQLTSVSLPMAKEYEGRWKVSVHYLPNGVDHPVQLDPANAKETLLGYGIDGDYLLFSAGRLDRTKGCHLLLKAFSGIETGLKLVIVGDEKTDPEYARELRKWTDPRIRFVPFISDKGTLFGIVQNAKLFVFPSAIEAMSMALLEAASLGVPIVCSDIPANQAVLPEGTIYFDSGDENDLEEKLRWALTHPEEMRERALKTQTFVRQNFSWDRIARQYDRLYQSMSGPRILGVNPWITLGH